MFAKSNSLFFKKKKINKTKFAKKISNLFCLTFKTCYSLSEENIINESKFAKEISNLDIIYMHTFIIKIHILYVIPHLENFNVMLMSFENVKLLYRACIPSIKQKIIINK